MSHRDRRRRRFSRDFPGQDPDLVRFPHLDDDFREGLPGPDWELEEPIEAPAQSTHAEITQALEFDPPPVERIETIKKSHALLLRFTPDELRILLSLKRNTSPKSWTVREDLVVLTQHNSNAQIAEILHERNKEAVKKRLQLLKSKGLHKRVPDPEDTISTDPGPETTDPQDAVKTAEPVPADSSAP